MTHDRAIRLDIGKLRIIVKSSINSYDSSYHMLKLQSTVPFDSLLIHVYMAYAPAPKKEPKK